MIRLDADRSSTGEEVGPVEGRGGRRDGSLNPLREGLATGHRIALGKSSNATESQLWDLRQPFLVPVSSSVEDNVPSSLGIVRIK